jgi:hypothetical protein
VLPSDQNARHQATGEINEIHHIAWGFGFSEKGFRQLTKQSQYIAAPL